MRKKYRIWIFADPVTYLLMEFMDALFPDALAWQMVWTVVLGFLIICAGFAFFPDIMAWLFICFFMGFPIVVFGWGFWAIYKMYKNHDWNEKE